MEFVISDNSCMFAMSMPKTINEHRDSGIFCTILSAIIFSDIRLSNPYWITTFRCCSLSLARREAIAFLNFIKSNFIQLMPKTSENLTKGSVASLSSTPTSAKTVKPRKLTKLEKSIQIMQERVKELRDGYEYERLEHCKCLFFIARNFPNSFVSFIKEFGEDADWEKLCNKELEITNSKKA